MTVETLVYVYLCIPGRMIYPRLPEIDEELMKLKHFEAIHDLCSLITTLPMSDALRRIGKKRAEALRKRGEVLIREPEGMELVIRGEPLVKGAYVVLRSSKSFGTRTELPPKALLHGLKGPDQ